MKNSFDFQYADGQQSARAEKELANSAATTANANTAGRVFTLFFRFF